MLVRVLLVTLLIVFAGSAFYIQVRIERLRRRSLRELLMQIKPVPLKNIVMLGQMKTAEDSRLSLEEILVLLGGEQVLETLSHNTTAIMDVARYLSLLVPECENLALQIRREALYVKQLIKFVREGDRLRIRPGAIRMLLSIAGKYSNIHDDTSKLYIKILDDIDKTLRMGVRAQFAVAVEEDSCLVKYTC